MTERGDESLSGPTLRAPRVVLRNARRRLALVWLGVLLLLFGTPVLGIAFGMLGTVVALVASLTSFVQAARVSEVRRIGGSVSLDGGGLRLTGGSVDEDVTYPTSAIVGGYRTRSDRTAVLELANGAQLVIHLEKDDPALLLDHAGVGVAQRALTLPLRGQLGAFTIGFVAVWPLLFFWMSVVSAFFRREEVVLLSGPALTALSTAFVVMRLGFPRVVVGTDGVRVVGTLVPRFIRHEEIERVELVPPTYQHGTPWIRILRRNAPPFALPTIAAPRERVEGLARRIDEAVRAHAAGGGGRNLDALARGDRPVARWKADLRRLALAPPTFRDQALGIDDYERVLADPAAAPDRRVGAALAVRAIDPVQGPLRIRVAASASADEALRAALEAAAEGEIDVAVLDRAVARRAGR